MANLPTAALLRRKLMRFPFSARLKYELRKAEIREARESKRALAEILKGIRGRLKDADLETLRVVLAELEQRVDHVPAY